MFRQASLTQLISLLFILSGTRPVLSQCLPDSVLMVKVGLIHGGPNTNARKIILLKQLQNNFLKCSQAKNAAYALLLHRLGDIYDKDGDTERAIFYTREAVQVNSLDRPGTDRSFLTNSYFNLGIFYKKLNLVRELQDNFDHCIAVGSHFKDKDFIVFMAFEQKAYTYYQVGDYEKSIGVADEGLAFALRRANNKARAPLLAQRAQAAGSLLLFKDADANIKEAIQLLEMAADDPVHLATCYSISAELLVKKKLPDAALEYYRKALKLNTISANLEQCARDLLDMGSVYADELNDWAKAISCYKQGVKLASQTGDLYQLAALYSNIGVVYDQQKMHTGALKFYQRALNNLPLKFADTAINANPDEQMLKLVSNDYFVITILSNKAKALLARYKQDKLPQDLTNALHTFELADQALDLMRWKQEGDLSKLLWRQKTKEMYEKCIEVCYYLKDPKKAYYFFEKSRAALLNDQLSGRAADNQLSSSDLATEKKLKLRIAVLSSKLMSGIGITEYANQKAKWLSAQQEWGKFVRLIEKKYPNYYRRKYDRTVYSFEELKKKLTVSDQCLVEYFNGENTIYAISICSKGQKLLKIDYSSYKKDLSAFTAFCSSPSLLNSGYDQYRELAYRLYNNLFRPLGIPSGRVIICPDEHFIPFEALLSDAKINDSFLAHTYTFSYVPAVRVLMKVNNSGQAKYDFIGIAPLNYDRKSGLAELAGADKSIDRIAVSFETSKVFKGASASKVKLITSFSQARLLQLYAHADADEALKEPQIYLSDQPIYLSELEKLNMVNTDLVVLSACNTGVGRYAGGEGVFSLARGFMIAGVPSVVTNLWKIDDQVTYKLTESFYRYMQEGFPKDVALNKAKLELMQDKSKMYQMPYYWAATIVIGDTSVIKKHRKISSWMWISGAVLILLSMTFLVKHTLSATK